MLSISIHASRGGSDANSVGIVSQKTFQSTLPAGEATNADNAFIQQLTISIHASRGGSDEIADAYYQADGISIHASRRGSDQ